MWRYVACAFEHSYLTLDTSQYSSFKKQDSSMYRVAWRKWGYNAPLFFIRLSSRDPEEAQTYLRGPSLSLSCSWNVVAVYLDCPTVTSSRLDRTLLQYGKIWRMFLALYTIVMCYEVLCGWPIRWTTYVCIRLTTNSPPFDPEWSAYLSRRLERV